MEKSMGTQNTAKNYHLLSNFVITVNGDTATAWSRWAFVVPGQQGAAICAGRTLRRPAGSRERPLEVQEARRVERYGRPGTVRIRNSREVFMSRMKRYGLACPCVCCRCCSSSPLLVAQSARIDDATLASAGQTGDDWLTYGLNQAETRFSPLKDIDTTNVKRLDLAWSSTWDPAAAVRKPRRSSRTASSTASPTGASCSPSTREPGKENWRWDPRGQPVGGAAGDLLRRREPRPRDLQGMVFAPVIDGRLQALDADTGKPVWEARVAYPQDHYTLTMAPRIAKGKVIIGASGGDRPTRGFFDAYDADDRPSRVALLHSPRRSIEAVRERGDEESGRDVGREEWWKNGGGGAVWDGLAYDPEAGLVYVGTGNAQPWTFQHRSSRTRTISTSARSSPSMSTPAS